MWPWRSWVRIPSATPFNCNLRKAFRFAYFNKQTYYIIENNYILGRSQGVRHGTLTPASAGSNPAVPARKKHLFDASAFFNEILPLHVVRGCPYDLFVIFKILLLTASTKTSTSSSPSMQTARRQSLSLPSISARQSSELFRTSSSGRIGRISSFPE